MLRTVKNRFGPTFETGVFEMTGCGLAEVDNPSELFMGSGTGNRSGSVVVPCLEGTRPILVEIQALVTQSYLAMPRRTATGIDSNRLALLVAVIEKHLQYQLYDKDIFVNATGGIRISEPAADLGIMAAILSSLLNKPVREGVVIFGETGLTGETRSVSRTDLRISEAERLGFRECVVPAAREGIKHSGKIRLSPVSSVKEAMESVL
jgi:DNA repair protein RadA/Sms